VAVSVPDGHRFEATQALRQVLNRAVAWGLLDFNPAKLGVPNPARRAGENRPFETWGEVEASTSGSSDASTGGPRRSRPVSIRSVASTTLRHTYATFALRAGVPVFAVSRFMGTSIAIDRHARARSGVRQRLPLLEAPLDERRPLGGVVAVQDPRVT
jgi:hypothetical protein